MKKILTLILWLSLSKIGTAQVNSDKFIFPDPNNKIMILEAVKSNTDLLSGKVLNNDLLKDSLKQELDKEFHKSVIKLNQCSRNFAKNTQGPNVLLLSQNSGGFARHGLTLIEEDKSSDYPDLNYVDLVVREQNFQRGSLVLYSHELGHAMMHNLWTSFGENADNFRSPKMHASMGITDYYTSISEGFGEHFQRLAFENIDLYKNNFEDRYRNTEYRNSLWHSRLDEELRINGVLENKYIYKKLLPQGIDLNKLNSEDKILINHTSPIFDPTQLKNAQQMLSSEGLLATIFYKMNTNSILKNNYLKKEFYNKFLIYPISKEIEVKEIFTPFENVMLKHFHIWNILNEKDLVGKTPFIEYINEWITEFPQDKEELVKLFITTTIGKTVSNDLGKIFEQLSFQGIIGDYFNYVKTLEKYEKELDKLIKQVMNNEIKIDQNIGPEIWIENKDFQIRWALWVPNPKNNLNININTANEFEFSTFKNIDINKAREIISKRESLGYFTSIKQLEEFGLRFEN